MEPLESGVNSSTKREIRFLGFGNSEEGVEFKFIRTFKIGVKGGD